MSYIDPNGLDFVIYHCVTTAIHQDGYGWVPGSDITTCNRNVLARDFDTSLISHANEGHSIDGGGGGVTQVAGPIPPIPTVIYPGGHEYEVENVICENANGVPEAARSALLNLFTVPSGDPRPITNLSINSVYDPRVSLFGHNLWGGFVTTEFSNNGLTGTNETTIIHPLHDGSITRTLSESNGSLIVTTIGTGMNFNQYLAAFNQTQGPEIFNAFDSIMRNYVTNTFPGCGN